MLEWHLLLNSVTKSPKNAFLLKLKLHENASLSWMIEQIFPISIGCWKGICYETQTINQYNPLEHGGDAQIDNLKMLLLIPYSDQNLSWIVLI